jgi:hypothetical protein
MFAFVIHSVALQSSDINNLASYFVNQVVGYNNLLLQQQAAQQQVTSLTTTVSNVQSQLADFKSKYAQCQTDSSKAVLAANAAALAHDALGKWQIKMPESDVAIPKVDPSTLASCSPLAVKKFGGAVSSVSVPEKSDVSNSGNVTIKYPNKDVDAATAKAPASAPAPAPAPADKKDTTSLWKTILGIAKE